MGICDSYIVVYDIHTFAALNQLPETKGKYFLFIIIIIIDLLFDLLLYFIQEQHYMILMKNHQYYVQDKNIKLKYFNGKVVLEDL